jgi:AcrR family transcriptional regulator
MIMGMRKYTLRRRAERQDETRRRITEAAVELHGTVGPARTTISALAERAGVERHTVYRHFPDEASLLRACTSHWAARHPLPDPVAWGGIGAPRARLQAALSAWYAYYRDGESMLANVLRDAPVVPAIGEVGAGIARFLDGVCDGLTQGWEVDGRRRAFLRAFIGHALRFETWRSLVRGQGLDERQAARLMADLAAAYASAGAVAAGGDGLRPADQERLEGRGGALEG